MSRLKPKALSNPPSQTPLEGGSDSARPFTSNTVASTPLADSLRSEFVNLFADRDRFEGWELDDGGAAEVR